MSCKTCPHWQADHHSRAVEYDGLVGYCPPCEQITHPDEGEFCELPRRMSDPSYSSDRSDPSADDPSPGPLAIAAAFFLFAALVAVGAIALRAGCIRATAVSVWSWVKIELSNWEEQ